MDVSARRFAPLPPATEVRTSPCNAEQISRFFAAVAAIILISRCIFIPTITPANRYAHNTAAITAVLRIGWCISRPTAVIIFIAAAGCYTIHPAAANIAVRVIGPAGLSTGLCIARGGAVSANRREVASPSLIFPDSLETGQIPVSASTAEGVSEISSPSTSGEEWRASKVAHALSPEGQQQVLDVLASVRQGMQEFRKSIGDQLEKVRARFLCSCLQASKEISSDLARVREESALGLVQVRKEFSRDCERTGKEIRDACAQVGERIDRMSARFDETGLALKTFNEKLSRYEVEEREALKVLTKSCDMRLNLEEF
jgi:hypothetical protein